MSIEIANNTNINATTSSVFRFKFNTDINSILQRFASIHHGDDLEEFKDSWDTFLTTYRTAIDIETQRLREIGFQGDVENKMFTSVRYYYCKQFKIGNTDVEEKVIQEAESESEAKTKNDDADADEKSTEKKSKRKYVKINSDIHNTIDQFLENNNKYTCKPALAWSEFCTLNGDDFCPKKTFKNRIYNIREKYRKRDGAANDAVDDGAGIGPGVIV